MQLSTQTKHTLLYWLLLLQLFRNYQTVKADETCPTHCTCLWIMGSLHVDCSGKALTEYPNVNTLPLEYVDFSHNRYQNFPTYLADYKTLKYLDLSHNEINYLEVDALHGFINLETLILAYNGIDIDSDVSLMYARNLHYLNLNGNPLQEVFGSMEMLQSDSLRDLRLENCRIETFEYTFDQNLPNLEYLNLNSNPIRRLYIDNANNMKSLELANCSLQELPEEFLNSNLPALTNLNLSWNMGLEMGFMTFKTLKRLDLSYCYLNEVNISQLVNITHLKLEGNTIRSVNSIILPSRNSLELLDLSRNFLTFIEVNAFSHLYNLKYLDLSYNDITHVEPDTLSVNKKLTFLNLSHNFIQKFTKLKSSSLRDLDLSWCQIVDMEDNVLAGLANVKKLNLSNNLLRELSVNIESKTLQQFDLSYCRLTFLHNKTFHRLPQLTHVRLNGNRLTLPLSTFHFRSNKYLNDLWLYDNPWICNCEDEDFREFYNYLTQPSTKILHEQHLKCASPIPFYGLIWQKACRAWWLPEENSYEPNRGRNFWFVILLSIGLIVSFYVIMKCLRRYLSYRRKRLNHEEYCRNQRELRHIRRLNQQILHEDALPNAPNPSDTFLPTYEDALKMPKPVRPTKSMMNLPLASSRRKRMRARNKPSNETLEYSTEDDEADDLSANQHHKRFHSEEMLSQRNQERTARMEPQRRSRRFFSSRSYLNAHKEYPASCIKTQNLQSAEQIANFQNYENSPYTKRKPKIMEIPPFKRCTLQANSIEFLTDSEIGNRSNPHSPFSQRKPKIKQRQRMLASEEELMPAIENYFELVKNSKNSSPQSSGDFHVIVQPDIHSLKDDWEDNTESETESNIDLLKTKQKSSKKPMELVRNSSSSEEEPIVVVHKSTKETLF